MRLNMKGSPSKKILFVSRYVEPLIANIPTITYDFPRITGSERYEIMGGTLHSKNINQFGHHVRGLMEGNAILINDYESRRNKYLEENIGFNNLRKHLIFLINTILRRHKSLINQLKKTYLYLLN